MREREREQNDILRLNINYLTLVKRKDMILQVIIEKAAN